MDEDSWWRNGNLVPLKDTFGFEVFTVTEIGVRIFVEWR